VMGYEDEAGALGHEGAEAFAEVALGGEVEGVGWLVEQELLGAMDEGAGDLDAALFSGGHFADSLVCEVGGVDAFEGFGGAVAHFFGNDEVGPEGAGAEEAGDDGVGSGGAAGGASGGVDGFGGGVKAGMAVGDSAEVLAEFGEVPAWAAEDADFHSGLDDWVQLAVHGADEGGFTATVGAEDGYVFSGLDGEVDVVEDDAVAEGYVDVAHSEKRVVGGFGSHLIC